jgi:N,N'-diacetyllegionaminate synthase
MSELYNAICNSTKIFVVAEMAWAHDGSLEKAKKIILGASNAGADAINLHVTSLAHYMVENYGSGEGRLSNTTIEKSSVYNYLEKINLSFSDYKILGAYAKELGLKLSVMCNDLESLNYVSKEVKPDLLMIHPSCITDDDFVQKNAEQGIPLVIYCGGLLLGEIERAITLCTKAGNSQLILQHGFQSYPTLIEDNNLRYLATLKNLFDYPIAFGDHTDGGDPFALIVPLLAIPYGIKIIEKHITFDRNEKGEDYESALDLTTFPIFVDYLRKSEMALGSSTLRPLSERELKYRQVVLKKATVNCNLKKGENLLPSHITYKRSDNGILPAEMNQILNNRVCLNKDLTKGMPICAEDIYA